MATVPLAPENKEDIETGDLISATAKADIDTGGILSAQPKSALEPLGDAQ